MKLPEGLLSWLETEAKRARQPKSALVREILRQHQQRQHPSALDLTADLCGCAESGLGDLKGVSQPYCHISVYILSNSQLKYHRVPMRRRLEIHSLVIVMFVRNSAASMTFRFPILAEKGSSIKGLCQHRK